MRDKILQFARGDFSGARSKLIISENQIVLEASEGQSTIGSLYIGNENGTDMKGLIISDCNYLKVYEDRFSGKEATINYEFNARSLQAGETIYTELAIISSCGEARIPVTATVGIPSVTYSGGRISDLTEFAALADVQPDEALKIFLSEDFKKIFLYRDLKNQALYDALLKSPDKMYALEEFLIAARKRTRIYKNMPDPDKEESGVSVKLSDPYENLINYYIQLKCGHITRDEFSDTTDMLLIKHRDEYSDLHIRMMRAYSALITGKNDLAKSYAIDLISIAKPSPGADMGDVLDYSCIRYLSVLVSALEEMTQNAAWASKEIRYYYENGYDHYILLWFLINLENKYTNTRAAFGELSHLIHEGCTSPLIYYEFCKTVKNDPDLMHEWDDCMIEPLIWGIKEKLFDGRMALIYTYHVSRIRDYDDDIFKSLEILYDEYELEDTLNAICLMLIRNDMISPDYLRWYELGIEKQLSITNIYEAYMCSLPDDAVRIIPHQIMLYFMYDNNLADREKELLYASAVRDKDNNPSIYKAYSVMISNYARHALEEGKINDALAVLYEDTIKINSVDETIAVCLPNVMFCYRVECDNDEMKSVCVVHKELAGEQCVQLSGGAAYIDLYSDNAIIMLADDDGNRYMGTEYYTLKKMVRLETYADRCFEVSSDNIRLVKYMFIRMTGDLHAISHTEMIRRRAREAGILNQYYERNNTLALIRFYYEHAEGERLEGILGETDPEFGPELTDYYVAREMYEKAYRSVKMYGTEGVNEQYLAGLFDEYYSRREPDTHDETLLEVAYSLYRKGSYTVDMIRYLADNYMGVSDRMFDIYKVAEGFDINKKNIEERLLTQLLFTENEVRRGIKPLESYITYGQADADLKKGYISYLSYVYLTGNEDMTEPVWKYLMDNYLTEYNTVCNLAMMKRYSLQDKLSPEEKQFCENRLEKMAEKGIVLPFFERFGGNKGKRYVMCIASPGRNISIRYRVKDDAVYTAVMKEVYYGMYVREIVVFIDEKLTYEFIEEKGGRKNIIGHGELVYEDDGSGEISRYRMINKMIKHYNAGDMENLYSCMETYVKLEEASHELFEIL